MIRRLRHRLTEFRSLTRLLNMPRGERPLVVYSEDSFSWIQYEALLAETMGRYGWPVVYITSDPEDPRLVSHPPQMSVFYLDRMLPGYLPKLDSQILLMTMPELESLHIKRPRQSRCLYVFHSLNSIHMVYRPRSFDHYDIFFCTGEHHYQELAAHFSRLDREPPELFRVGYPKLDRIYHRHRSYTKKYPDLKTVLVAPSWGDRNLLEGYGHELTEKLLSAGYRVVVRPHPCFFLPVYPGGRVVVEDLARDFGGHPRFILERSIDTEDAFHEADLMLSDWSGAAYEYAFGTERPVLFFDVPRKELNPAWKDLGLVPFEDRMRTQAGYLCALSEITAVGERVDAALRSGGAFRDRLRTLREQCVYNFGRSAEVGAEILNGLLRARAS